MAGPPSLHDAHSGRLGLLTAAHLHELEVGSAIPDDLIEEEGVYSLRVGDPPPIPHPGFRHPNSNKGQIFPYWPREITSGLVFPCWDHAGRPNYRIKPDHPRTIYDEDGNPSRPKYEGCGGARVSIYVPKRVRPWLMDVLQDLWITEGEKKTMAGAAAGLCIIGLSGVDCWSYKPNPADKTELGSRGRVASEPLPDWKAIALRGRIVFIAFDSDVMTKSEVQWALRRLTAFLRSQGATVVPITLPSGPNGEKQGLDDYIAARLAAGDQS